MKYLGYQKQFPGFQREKPGNEKGFGIWISVPIVIPSPISVNGEQNAAGAGDFRRPMFVKTAVVADAPESGESPYIWHESVNRMS